MIFLQCVFYHLKHKCLSILLFKCFFNEVNGVLINLRNLTVSKQIKHLNDSKFWCIFGCILDDDSARTLINALLLFRPQKPLILFLVVKAPLISPGERRMINQRDALIVLTAVTGRPAGFEETLVFTQFSITDLLSDPHTTPFVFFPYSEHHSVPSPSRFSDKRKQLFSLLKVLIPDCLVSLSHDVWLIWVSSL